MDFDKQQEEFFELYNKIYDEEIILKANDNGNKSLWSALHMIEYKPLIVERSWGNLFFEDIFERRPNKPDRISEAIYQDNVLTCIKFWFKEELTGFANFEHLNANTIKETRVLLDDDEQELVGIIYFSFDNKKNVIKTSNCHRNGIKQEEYIYKDDKISKIVINEKTSIDYIYELPNGIIDKPIRTETIEVEYKGDQVSAVYNGKGENMYVKK